MRAVDAIWSELRGLLGFEDLPALGLPQLRAAVKRMRPRAGRGVDQLRPTGVERLPGCALAELLDLCSKCEQAGCWPWQLLLVT
eukprot:1279889-Pyramimonas_sp.AAC.1